MSDINNLTNHVIEIKSKMGSIESTLSQLGKNFEKMDVIDRKAEEAMEVANDAQEYAANLVKKAGWVGGLASTFVVGLVWFLEHIPSALAKIGGN